MTEATKTVLTRAEKYAKRIALLADRIAKDQVELAAIQLEADTASKLASVAPGTTIIAKLGRAGSPEVVAAAAVYEEDGVTIKTQAVAAKAATAGTLREVSAVVLGVKEEDSGSLRYKIEHGTGFDKDVDIIQASQIVSIVGEVEAPAELNPAAEALYAADNVQYN